MGHLPYRFRRRSGDRFVSCHLETFHQAQCHEMSYMKAVSGWVKTDVENCLSFVYHFTDFFFICYLAISLWQLTLRRSAFFSFLSSHYILILSIAIFSFMYKEQGIKKSLVPAKGRSCKPVLPP